MPPPTPLVTQEGCTHQRKTLYPPVPPSLHQTTLSHPTIQPSIQPHPQPSIHPSLSIHPLNIHPSMHASTHPIQQPFHLIHPSIPSILSPSPSSLSSYTSCIVTAKPERPIPPSLPSRALQLLNPQKGSRMSWEPETLGRGWGGCSSSGEEVGFATSKPGCWEVWGRGEGGEALPPNPDSCQAWPQPSWLGVELHAAT